MRIIFSGKATCVKCPELSIPFTGFSFKPLLQMSDSESSDLIDSEAGLEENEDEMLLSSEAEEESLNSSVEEDDSENEEEDSPEELFMEDEEGDEDEEEDEEDNSSADEDRKLTEDELHRLYLDDFSSDDEVSVLG